MKVKSESDVAQLCPTLSDPMDCSLPGSSIHGIFQARVLEWGAIAFSGFCVYIFIYDVCVCVYIYIYMGFPGGSVIKNPPASAGATRDSGSIPGSGRPPREGNDNPF